MSVSFSYLWLIAEKFVFFEKYELMVWTMFRGTAVNYSTIKAMMACWERRVADESCFRSHDQDHFEKKVSAYSPPDCRFHTPCDPGLDPSIIDRRCVIIVNFGKCAVLLLSLRLRHLMELSARNSRVSVWWVHDRRRDRDMAESKPECQTFRECVYVHHVPLAPAAVQRLLAKDSKVLCWQVCVTGPHASLPCCQCNDNYS